MDQLDNTIVSVTTNNGAEAISSPDGRSHRLSRARRVDPTKELPGSRCHSMATGYQAGYAFSEMCVR
jgi:hypothetical protein